MKIALIGFGEVGQTFAAGFLKNDGVSISAFDIAFGHNAALRDRAEALGVEAAGSAALAAVGADVIVSAVTADQCEAVAQEASTYLSAEQILFDVNSASPNTKRRAAQHITARGGSYVEGAVMAAVLAPKLAVPILGGGVRAVELADKLNPLGMNITPVATEIGEASATKLCRSIMIKGWRPDLGLRCCREKGGRGKGCLCQPGRNFPIHRLAGTGGCHGRARSPAWDTARRRDAGGGRHAGGNGLRERPRAGGGGPSGAGCAGEPQALSPGAMDIGGMVMQTGIRCMLMRGGTSKGAYFLADDLPSEVEARDRILLEVMGSPDPRQVDGVGGAHPLTSKVAIVSRSTMEGCDVDFLFCQVVVDKPVVDTSPNCGNILAGVAPFAIERGLVEAEDGITRVVVRTINTGTVAELEVQTPGRRVRYDGDARIDGVPGTSAPISIDFRDAAGSMCGSLLPTGNAVDVVDGVEVTLIDNGMPVIVLAAESVGRTGQEPRDQLDKDLELKARLERIRLAAGPMMNLETSRAKLCLRLPWSLHRWPAATSPPAALSRMNAIPPSVSSPPSRWRRPVCCRDRPPIVSRVSIPAKTRPSASNIRPANSVCGWCWKDLRIDLT